MTNNSSDLRAEVAALAARVSALESALQNSASATPLAGPTQTDTFWALDGLEARRTDSPDTADGIVMIVGSLTLPTGTPVAWQLGAASDELLETDWSERATAFAALGHPIRVELLRHVLAGVTTTAQLAELESLGTTGQLHHHLKQLLAVGWLRQSGRGNYEVPPSRVVPLLTSILGAAR